MDETLTRRWWWWTRVLNLFSRGQGKRRVHDKLKRLDDARKFHRDRANGLLAEVNQRDAVIADLRAQLAVATKPRTMKPPSVAPLMRQGVDASIVNRIPVAEMDPPLGDGEDTLPRIPLPVQPGKVAVRTLGDALAGPSNFANAQL